jgi:cell division protein FtsB
MKHYKKFFLRAILVAEVLVFAGFYFFGAHGIKALHQHEREAIMLNQEIGQLKAEVQHLKIAIHEWTTFPWYREKIAREELQLAYPHEEIIIM